MRSLQCFIRIIKVYMKIKFPMILCHTILKFLSLCPPNPVQVSLPSPSAQISSISLIGFDFVQAAGVTTNYIV